MIINISRMKTSATCWRKAFNTYHRHLEGARSMNLVDGSAFHAGVAYGMAKRDWAGARREARRNFDESLPAANILPEESFKVDTHWKIVERILEVFEENYAREEYQVIQPECQFEVALPDSMHNCIFMHWWDYEEAKHCWGAPPADKILRGTVRDPHSYPLTSVKGNFIMGIGRKEQCACWQPHRFAGKTDNIVAWQNNIWLHDHKTTAIVGQQFWDQWLLDVQPTGYIYGIWKTLGIRPRGFVINALIKPSEAQVAAYNNRRKNGPAKEIADYISFERQAFLRTEEDLLRFERQARRRCDEWEWRVKNGYFDMEPIPGSCISYNRLCDFHGCCTSHDQPSALEALATREPDYVEQSLVQLTNLRKEEQYT